MANKEAAAMVTTAISTGGANTLIRNELRTKYGLYLKPKDIQNLRFAQTGNYIIKLIHQTVLNKRFTHQGPTRRIGLVRPKCLPS